MAYIHKIKYIIGIDEAGRGPLAGPISVGLVMIKNKKQPSFFRHVKESKSISEKKREELFNIICKNSKKGVLDYKVSLIGNSVIDKIGIVKATKKAISNVLNRMCVNPRECIIFLDGGIYAPVHYINQKTIIGGDRKKKIIAAASIVAKVKRDKKMKRIDTKYPEYGFERHKGYGTKLHYERLGKYGISPVHRESYVK